MRPSSAASSCPSSSSSTPSRARGPPIALNGVIVGELIGAERGLGKLIIEAEGPRQRGEMMVAIFVMMISGILLAMIARRLQSFLLRWQPQFEPPSGRRTGRGVGRTGRTNAKCCS